MQETNLRFPVCVCVCVCVDVKFCGFGKEQRFIFLNDFVRSDFCKEIRKVH